MKWLPFDQAMAWHLAKHATQGLTIGSKFFQASPWHPANPESYPLISDLYAELVRSRPVPNTPHWITSRLCDEDIGVNAVVPKHEVTSRGLKVYTLKKFVGTPHEYSYQAALLPTKTKLPFTREVHLVGGIYPQGNCGIYTLIPGKLTPMFPHHSQSHEYREYCIDFWASHVFLADAQEIYASIRQSIEKRNPSLSKSAIDAIMQEANPELCQKTKEVIVRKILEDEKIVAGTTHKKISTMRENLKRDTF